MEILSGQHLESLLNRLPSAGGRVQKHVWVPHLQQMVTQTEQVNRMQILQENVVMYEENRKKFLNLHKRKEMAGGYPMRIPEYDLEILREKIPELRLDAPKEDRRKAFIKLYKQVKEYRIG